jgi:hypothetical protein
MAGGGDRGSPPGARAAKAATSTIPIVFGVGEDPVKLGLVASIARPGGNATGINFLTAEVVAKRLAVLHELVPSAARVSALINPSDAIRAEAVRNDLEAAVRTMGLQLQILNASSSREIDVAFAALAIFPEPSEPVRRHRCVAHGRGNRAVTEIVLNCPRVVPVIGELVAAGMPQHVAVDQERETRGLAGAGNHPLITRNAQWRIPLGNEDVNA